MLGSKIRIFFITKERVLAQKFLVSGSSEIARLILCCVKSFYTHLKTNDEQTQVGKVKKVTITA